MQPTIRKQIRRVQKGENLTREETRETFTSMMAGALEPQWTAALICALKTKGETVDELVGAAEAMRQAAKRVTSIRPCIDTCGTGGDGISTFNVSTTAAIIAAAGGAVVAKHGNRSSTSKSGSADVLEALGADIDLHPDAVAECLAETGVGFMFAPRHHPSFKHVVPVRRALGVHTVFNLIGPLANPAGAPRQVLGVADPAALGRIAAALAELGSERALVVRGRDGMDELSTAEISDAYDVRDGTATHIRVDPAVLGITRPWPEALKGGEPHENAAVITAVLEGEPGAPREVVALNAGAAIWIAGAAEDLAHGYETALRSIDGGAARERCAAFVAATKRLAAA